MMIDDDDVWLLSWLQVKSIDNEFDIDGDDSKICTSVVCFWHSLSLKFIDFTVDNTIYRCWF